MSSWLSPYSSEYSIDMCAAGSLPGFRTGTKGRRMRSAIAAPNRKPRDSDAHDGGGVASRGVHAQLVHAVAEGERIGEQRRDVAEEHALPGEVGNVTDASAQVHGERF